MASRHVFTQRLKSGVIFSAPGNLLAMPEGGWGDDTPINRSKKPKRKVKNLGLDHFSHWVAKVTPYDEPYDTVESFMSGKDTRGIGNEYRPYSISPYPEAEVETASATTSEMTLCLPMLSVSLTVTVDGTVSHTELVQKFHNPSDIIIESAKHVFPLYDGAAITSFECTIGDERRVRGVVKPKVQARKEFEEAVRDKVAAPALLEEHTPEIFETSLGNIPADTTVEIKITYVQELKVVMMESEATEGIALTIPMSIAPRYSKTPIEWEPASKVPEEKLDIWIKVADNGKVNHEGCDEESGHLLQFEGSKPVEYSNFLEKDASSKTYYVWHHVSEPVILRKDFVFVIQMKEGHHIKSRAIARPADDNGFAAVTVNIRPNDLFRNAIIPQSFTGEILFLLDQSGSMEWSNGSPDYGRRHTGSRKIDVMREAMLLALSGIPSTCVFNVISWGSATMGLWETSRPHTQENIREAKGYVSQVEADMGGTDLLRALESVVKRRVQGRGSTQIIILTDGELEPEESIEFIWKKRQLFGDRIRFFALGIGDEVSHRLVESIAECGGGYSDVVHTTQTPRWHDRLNRLLKSALEPNSWSCGIDLGSQFERKDLTDFKLRDEKALENGKTPYIQAPFPISSLHPFSFASISFLVDLRHSGELPKTVTISTTTAGAKKKTYELPIDASSGSDGTIHRLVAKSVLLDLQDQIKRGTAETKIAKENAENIGTTYSVTSKWTSFVAISENQPTQTVEEQKMNHYKALFDEIDIDELLNNVDDDKSTTSGYSSISSLAASLNLAQLPIHGDYGQLEPMTETRARPERPFYNHVPGSHAGDRPTRPSPERYNSHSDKFVRRTFSDYRPQPSPGMLPYTLHVSPGTNRELESVNPIPVPAPMPRFVPVRPSSGMSLPPGFMGGSQDVRPVPRGRLDEENDEPEALHPVGSPVSQHMSDPVQVEPQGPGDMIAARKPRARSKEVPGPRSWEDQDSSESRAWENSVSDDVRIPTRERIYDDSSPAFIGADFPLYPNESDWQEAETLERSRADTVDDSLSDSPPRVEKRGRRRKCPDGMSETSMAEAHSGSRRTGKGRTRRFDDFASEGESDGSATQGSQPHTAAENTSPSGRADGNNRVLESANSTSPLVSYVPPIVSGRARHVPRPKSVATRERLSEKVHQFKESAQVGVADEPMVAPSANRGFAIPAAIIKQEEPHASDYDDAGKMTESIEETEVGECKLEVADTEDVVPPHGVAYSPTAEVPLASRQWYDVARKRRQPAIHITSKNPPETSCYSEDRSHQVITPKLPPLPSDPPRSRLQARFDSCSEAGISTSSDKLPTSTSSPEAEMVERTSAPADASDDDGPWDEVSEVPSSMPKGLPIDTCGEASYSSETGTERVSTQWSHMPSNAMARAGRSSQDGGTGSVDLALSERFLFHPSMSQDTRPYVDKFGRGHSSQASSQFGEHSSSDLNPQIQRETVPGGPKYPTYKAIPIPNLRCATWGPDYDSEDSSMSQGILESLPSRRNVYGPLDWQFAMECQDGQGLFNVDEKRPSLHLHFCPETVTKFSPNISGLLHNSTILEQGRDDISARLLDTLMMIECYKTHRAQEEDTWDLMMERAWDAVISVLGLSDEEEALEELAGQLRRAMMHAHYVVATGVKDSEKDENNEGTTRCPACDVIWRTKRQFFCPFDHASDGVDEFTSWDEFWKHQVSQGHVVCAQEVIYQ
ncbi:Vault poly [Fusarium fujikuroi]|nr:Vault poly [Fusarium fujikuroi]